MKKVIIAIYFLFIYSEHNAQVGIGTTVPEATLDINGNLIIRSVSTSTSTNVLTIDSNNVVTKKYTPETYAARDFEIPKCNSVSVGSTGLFNTTVNSTLYTIVWTVLAKQEATTSTTSLQRPSRLRVRYDISPALPFVPDGLTVTANNKSNYPDTFSINYTEVTDTRLTVNITRTDLVSKTSGTVSWIGQFYFMAFFIKM